ncbi:MULTISPECIES: DUF1993 domain-containing protein [Henriciella]|jgi:hypothetical protein|uniref:DUF1993 domain-containing protein n=1 Tax=Henriciella pelagia TaxID=1977912 RepID=A0ABQ1JIM8_9PROT|nr:DUF1993 domain-containing protein [Henriciella pelagia]GGB67225.1 hypothetical protein GCM10011503_15020 [Henriciella pelagia]
MTISLYDAVIPPMRQIVGSVQGVLAKGAKHCEAEGKSADALLSDCIHETMLPLTFQLDSVIHHSIGAIDGVRAGEFNAASGLKTHDYAGYQAALAETDERLKALSPDDVNALGGKDVIFRFREQAMPFTAEGFLFSFSKPNLYFHATTAYDILRMKGVPLGKRDYLGQIQLKTG